jgi:hypothetical protein
VPPLEAHAQILKLVIHVNAMLALPEMGKLAMISMNAIRILVLSMAFVRTLMEDTIVLAMLLMSATVLHAILIVPNVLHFKHQIFKVNMAIALSANH